MKQLIGEKEDSAKPLNKTAATVHQLQKELEGTDREFVDIENTEEENAVEHRLGSLATRLDGRSFSCLPVGIRRRQGNRHGCK